MNQLFPLTCHRGTLAGRHRLARRSGTLGGEIWPARYAATAWPLTLHVQDAEHMTVEMGQKIVVGGGLLPATGPRNYSNWVESIDRAFIVHRTLSVDDHALNPVRST